MVMADYPEERPVHAGELAALLSTVHVKLDDLKGDLAEVKNQTMKTNGRVDRLEQKSDVQRGWLQAIGFIIALPATLGSILGVIIALEKL